MAEENESVGKMTVVHKAKVRCSYSQSSTRLQVTNNENGNGAAGEHIIATEKDCKAGVNLIPYQRCYSPYLVSTMALLYGDLSNEYMNVNQNMWSADMRTASTCWRRCGLRPVRKQWSIKCMTWRNAL